MATFYCELAWLGGDCAAADVIIETDGDRIVAVTPDAGSAPAAATELAGLTLPGLANAHSHAFHRVLRGRTHGGTGSFWTWRDQMYAVAAALDPERYHRLARAVFGEMVRAGITVVGEFHYIHHGANGVLYEPPNAMGRAVIAAAADAGLRLTLLDTCYLHGGIGVALDETQQRFSDGDASTWAARATALADELDSSPMVRIGAAVHSVRAVDPAAMEVVAAWAAARDAPLHAHVSEQPGENEQCLDAYGVTPVELLAERGLLGPRFTAVHATHVTEGNADRLGAAGAWCCFCPTTEKELADGIGPARTLVDAGARLALGSDSHAVIDLLEEARAVELHERLSTNVRGSFNPGALLTMATAHGYASLGWPEGGRLEAGTLADFVTIGADSVRTAGLAGDPLGVVVFAAGAADVRHVVVGGEVVVADSRHVRLDVESELRSALAEIGP